MYFVESMSKSAQKNKRKKEARLKATQESSQVCTGIALYLTASICVPSFIA